MGCTLAIDQGTTSCRAMVFERDGTVRAVAQRGFEQLFPSPGWVEHDPAVIWSTQAGVIAEALTSAGVRAGDVASIGITNQRETVVVWDRATGEPVHNAIVWQDRRTTPMCERLRDEGLEPLIRDRTGLVLDSYFSATKLAWLLDNVPGVRARAERGELAAGTIDSWLLWKLTGGRMHATDVTNASRTMLFDLHRLAWDAELCALFGVPMVMLPGVVASSSVVAEASARIGLEGVQIAGIAGDQQAALVGQRCTEPGMAKNTYGTGCFLLVNTGHEPRASGHRLLTTVGWRRGSGESAGVVYAMEGAVFVAGAIVQWLRDGLGVIRSAEDVEGLAASVPDTGGVVLVPALTGLGAPHWDPRARGTIVGLTRGTTAAHLARAALEGIACQVVDLVRAMEDDGAAITELRVDGGASTNDLLMRMQADLLQKPVVRAAQSESTALGAAVLAAEGVGAPMAMGHDRGTRFEPEIGTDHADSTMGRWREAVARSGGWA